MKNRVEIDTRKFAWKTGGRDPKEVGPMFWTFTAPNGEIVYEEKGDWKTVSRAAKWVAEEMGYTRIVLEA